MFAAALVFLILSSHAAFAGHISGRVVDPVGRPVPRAGFYVDGLSWIAYTDSNGTFKTPEVIPDRWTASIEKFGWAGKSFPVFMPSGDLVLPTMVMAFGDLDENGSVDLKDAMSFEERLA